MLGRLSVSGATVFRAALHFHPVPLAAPSSQIPFFSRVCLYGTAQLDGLYGCSPEPDEPAATTSKREHWHTGWTLIRFAEPTAVDTVIDKRSQLLLLASNRCKPLRSASVRLQGAPRSGCSVLAREPMMGLCLSPSSCQTQTSATRGQTTRATVLLWYAEQPWRPVGHILHPVWPLSIPSPKPTRPARPNWLSFKQPRESMLHILD